MPEDPQATAYDDFNEDRETVFRVFDEGDKRTTRRPGSSAVLLDLATAPVVIRNVEMIASPVGHRGGVSLLGEAHSSSDRV